MADDKKDDYIIRELRDVKESMHDLRKEASNIDKTLVEYKASFDHHIKQDELMYEEFRKMNEVLMENTASLKEHIHRTNLLEDAVMKMDTRLAPLEIEKIKRQALKDFIFSGSVWLAKIVGGAGALIGLIAAIHKYM